MMLSILCRIICSLIIALERIICNAIINYPHKERREFPINRFDDLW